MTDKPTIYEQIAALHWQDETMTAQMIMEKINCTRDRITYAKHYFGISIPEVAPVTLARCTFLERCV